MAGMRSAPLTFNKQKSGVPEHGANREKPSSFFAMGKTSGPDAKFVKDAAYRVFNMSLRQTQLRLDALQSQEPCRLHLLNSGLRILISEAMPDK